MDGKRNKVSFPYGYPREPEELKNKLALVENNLALLRDPKYLATIIKEARHKNPADAVDYYTSGHVLMVVGIS